MTSHSVTQTDDLDNSYLSCSCGASTSSHVSLSWHSDFIKVHGEPKEKLVTSRGASVYDEGVVASEYDKVIGAIK